MATSSRTSWTSPNRSEADLSGSSASSTPSGEIARSDRLDRLRRLWANRGQLGQHAPNPVTSLEGLEIEKKKGLDFAAFSPMAEFVAVAVGRRLQIFSWDRLANLRWTPCWTAIVLQDRMAASERMAAMALSKSLVSVAAGGGFEVYELHTAADVSSAPQRKLPVIPLVDVRGLKTMTLSTEASEICGRICVGTEDGRLLIWDIGRDRNGGERCVLLPLMRDDNTRDLPSAVAFSNDNLQICVGSANRRIYVYELSRDRWSLVKQVPLEGNFGSGTSKLIHFTAIGFIGSDHVAYTTISRFPAGCPAVLNLENRTRTAFSNEVDEVVDAQSLAVSPSGKRLVFVDGPKHRAMLIESSPRGSFNREIAPRTQVTTLRRGSNPFIAALAFTQLMLEDGSIDGRERCLVLDRMGTIQLF